jgi:NAD-dependent SIR2 family protein deacetylase/tetratricopeptide (TPR) repeat protein/protein-tyrosine phosphatase
MEISNAENINQAKSILKNAQRVLILTGAGISAESGVPTFRGGGGAPVWRGMPFEQLSSAEMVEKDLPLVWEWFDYRSGKVSECEPNAAHKTLAKVQQSNQFEEFVIATQNIDGLHAQAGAESVIELHGSLWRARCLNCKARKDLSEIPAGTRPPICDKCSNPMRPDVILFGEALPMDAFAQAKFFAEVCDVCIVVGTSALVYPAAELPLIAKQMGAKVIEINPEETSLTAKADLSIRGKAAEIVPQIFIEKDVNDDRLPTSETVKNTAEQNRADYQTKSPNTELETESLPAENQTISQNEMTSDSHPLRVDFVQSEEFPILNRLGMTFAPGKKQKGAMSGNWNRNMYRDMLRLREHYDVDLQVSLLEYEEFNELGLEGFEGQSERRKISLIKFPIRDESVPTSHKSFAKVIREIVRQLNDGKRVVVHCKGGLGRTGLTVACAIVAASRNQINSTEAIKMVRQARPRAIETIQQEKFVALFEEYWQIYSERIESLVFQQKNSISENVFEFKTKGMIERLFRFPTYDNRYFFYSTREYIYSDNSNQYDWEAEPVPMFEDGLDLLSYISPQIVPYKTPFIHPEYRSDLKIYLEKLFENTDSSITPEEWLAGVDDPTEWEHKVNNSNNVTEERESNTEIDKSEEPEELSDKHFLLCWKEQSVLDAQNSPHPLDVVSSRQLNRVNAGDTIWIVTVNQDGELILAGRLKAAEVVDYLTAVRRLHDANLWDGDYYALAKKDTAEEINLINLGERALELRFKNSGSDRLKLTYGKIRAQQLGSLRELTAESAQMLTEIWENAVFDFEDDNSNDANFSGKESGDDGYNIPDAADVEFFEDIARREPLNAEAHYNLGFVRGQTGDLEGSMQSLRRAVELDPDYFAAWLYLGDDHLEIGNLNEAIECFDKAIVAKPDFAIAHFMKGAAYDRMDNHEAAISSTRKGLEFVPDDAQAYQNLGISYLRLGDARQAADNFQKAAEITPDDARIFYRLGKCYRELGEKEQEFDVYLKAVELAPDFADAMFALGTVYAHLSGTAEGERVPYFETGGELILDDTRVFFYMGLGNLALGNVEAVREGQIKLREMDALLADRLQFFVDRFEEHPLHETRNDEDENVTAVAPDEKAATKTSVRQKRKSIEFYINDKSFEAKNIPEMYKMALEYLVDNRLLEQVTLPVATGEKRYILAREPIHPTGKPFLAPVEYRGYFMEAHNNRTAAIAQLKRLLDSVQVDFEFSEDEIVSAGTRPDVDKPVAQVTTQKSNEERFLGCLLGMAIGDALGTTAEFMSPGSFSEITSISGGGPFGLNRGEWTDDTSMALCLADSLIECGEFNSVDQMQRYCRWKNEGYLSSNGSAFDIGLTVRTALENFERQSEEELNPFCGSTSPSKAGNGSLMRLAPVVLFYANDAKRAISFAAESSRTTHGAREAVDACRYFAALITGALQGKSKEELLSAYFTPVKDLWETEPLSPKIAEIARGSFKDRKPPQIIGSSQGYRGFVTSRGSLGFLSYR